MQTRAQSALFCALLAPWALYPAVISRALPPRTACALRAHSFCMEWNLVPSSYLSAGHSCPLPCSHARNPVPAGTVSAQQFSAANTTLGQALPCGNNCQGQRDEGEGTNKDSCEETKLVLGVQARCWVWADIYVCWQMVWLEILSPNSIKPWEGSGQLAAVRK